MATETVYATSHLTGAFSNPTNAVGSGTGTWAGDLNVNSNYTSRWAIGDPTDPLTSGATQTVRVLARKGSNSGTPTIALNLWENGSLVQSILAATNVTSTVGQTLTGTFPTSAITNRANVEIEVVQVSAGGSPSVRNSAQIDYIAWDAEVTPIVDLTVVALLVSDAATVFTPGAAPGPVSVVVPLLADAAAVLTPGVAVGPVTVVALAVAAPATVHAPAGAQSLTAPHLLAAPTVHTPAAAVGPVTAVATFVANAPTVHTPGVGVGPVTVTVPLLAAPASVHSPAVARKVLLGTLAAPSAVHQPPMVWLAVDVTVAVPHIYV